MASGATVAGLPGDDDLGGQIVVLLSLPPDTDVLAVTNAIRQGALTIVRSMGEPLPTGASFDPGTSETREP